MHDIECILIGRATQRNRVKSTTNNRIVQFHFVLAPGHTQLTALKNWHKAREINRVSVQHVSPLGADLSQIATLVGRKVEEKVLKEPLVEEQLLDAKDLWRQRHKALCG